MAGTPAEETTAIERASTLELFLDLVFVFTVTQLTDLVSHPDGLRDYLQAALVLAMTWWMYDGYVWLTGNVSMEPATHRMAIFAGMAGYLLMALAIPGAFGAVPDASDSAVVFGLAYLGVTIIHAVLFTKAPNSSSHAILRIAPFNLAGALLVLAAAFVDDDWRWVCWLAAVAVVVSSTAFGRLRGWSLSASHFVERHGLVIIIALGESVVAIGVGAAGLTIDLALVVTALLALALSATLWWLYFDHDDEEAEVVLAGLSGDRRSELGMWFAYSHIVMIAGIVMAAAGVKVLVAHPTDATGTAGAWNLVLGVAVYVIGETLFRTALGLRHMVRRAIAVLALLATAPVGLAGSGLAQLAAVVAVMVVLLIAEAKVAMRRTAQA